jgi:hypothetical protein
VRALVMISFFSTGCFSSCGPSINTDTCDNGSNVGVTSVEIGTAAASDSETVPFVAMPEGAEVDGVHGGQGAYMIVARMRLSGNVPGCVSQATSVDNAFGHEVARLGVPLVTYPQGNMWVTKPIYLPGVMDGPATVKMAVGSATAARHITIGAAPGPPCVAAWECAKACNFGACSAGCVGGLSMGALAYYNALRSCQQAGCTDAGICPDMAGVSACESEEYECSASR